MLGNLGNVYQQSGRLDLVARHYRQALDIAEKTGWVAGQLANLENLGAVYWELGRLEDAVDHTTRALPSIVRATPSANEEPATERARWPCTGPSATAARSATGTPTWRR